MNQPTPHRRRRHQLIHRGLRLSVAALLAASASVASASTLAQIDVNDTTDNPADTQPGFSVLNLNSGGTGVAADTFNGIGVDVNAVGFSFGDNDRHRTTPTDSGALTQSALYRDFVFANNATTAGTNGLDVNLTGLDPNTFYQLTVWSYDTSSTGTRRSDWTTVGANGSVLAVSNYDMNGSLTLTDNTQRQFTVLAKSDASGNLALQGRNVDTDATKPTVFLNALQIDRPASYVAGQFDVNQAAHNATQAGYTGLADDGDSAGSTTFSATNAAGVTLSVTNSTDMSRDRGTGGALSGNPDANLLRDFSFNTAATVADALHVDLTGLAANTTYKVRVYSYDNGNNKAGSLWYNAASPASLNTTDPSLVGSFDINPASPDSGYIDLTLNSDASGEIHLTSRGSTGFGGNAITFLNGVSVTALPKYKDVIKVDVNNTNAGQGPTNVTKAGFVALSPSNSFNSGSVAGGAATDNGVTVTVTSDRNDSPTRNRNNVSDALFNDFIFANDQIQIDFAGLTVGNQYALTIFSQDTNGNSGNFTNWFLGDSTAPFKQGHFNYSNTGVSFNAYTFTTYFTATDANMTVYGRDANGSSLVFLNGLTLQSVPSPAALPAGLALLGAVGLRRRRRA